MKKVTPAAKIQMQHLRGETTSHPKPKRTSLKEMLPKLVSLSVLNETSYPLLVHLQRILEIIATRGACREGIPFLPPTITPGCSRHIRAKQSGNGRFRNQRNWRSTGSDDRSLPRIDHRPCDISGKEKTLVPTPLKATSSNEL